MAARTATVLPAPTSPHSTPRAASATQKPMRATASAWAVRHMRSRAAIRLVKGVLVKPKWATQGGRLAGGWVSLVGMVVVIWGPCRGWWAGGRLGPGGPGRGAA